MSTLSQFFINDNVFSVPIGGCVNFASSSPVITVDGKTYMRSGIVANPSDYPLVSENFLINPSNVWIPITMPASTWWISVTYGNGVFVAVAYDSSIAATSPDGITWTQRTLPASSTWISVTYGNGVFVAVAYDSSIAATSPDGITWTQRAMPVSAYWRPIVYGNGVFVAVAGYSGSSSIAASSPDGITWTQRTLPANTNWISVAYGNGVFLAVAYSSASIAASLDGITWTQRTGVSGLLTSIVYGNGIFISNSNSNQYSHLSFDGINWSQGNIPSTSCSNMKYGNGLFFMTNLSTNSTSAYTSNDGVNWTTKELYVNQTWSASCYENGVILLLPKNSVNALISKSYVGIPSYQETFYMRVA